MFSTEKWTAVKAEAIKVVAAVKAARTEACAKIKTECGQDAFEFYEHPWGKFSDFEFRLWKGLSLIHI